MDYLAEVEMTETERLDRVERELGDLRSEVQTCKLWEAGHDAGCAEKWNSQTATNAMLLAGMTELRATVAALSKKIWTGVGVLAVLAPLGAYLGSRLAG